MHAKLFVQCPKCQAKLGVDASWVGRRARCKKCRHEFDISSASMIQPEQDTSVEMGKAETIIGPTISPRVRETLNIKPVAEKFARFELVELIGEGAFGKVFKARDPNLGRLVALKIPAFSATEAKKTVRFLDEAKSAAALRHKNVVPVYEAGQFEGRPYIVSEFIEGQTLSKRIAAGAVEYKTAVTWIRDLARALAFAHQCGIIHRDVKSENIMLDANDVPFLMDFGLAKRLNEDSTRTLDGTVLGTPAYMPPEQARGEQKSIGPHSDQYSLAVVLYELLCRSRPFSGPTHTVIAQVISAEPPLPSAIVKSIPKQLEAICMKAMSKEIANRYSSAADFAEDLDCFIEGLTPAACHGRGRFQYNRLTSKMLTQIVVLSVVLVCIAVAFQAWRDQANTGSKSNSASENSAVVPPKHESQNNQAKIDALASKLGVTLFGYSTNMGCELDSATITKEFGELVVQIPALKAIHINNCTFDSGLPPLPVVSSLVHLRVHNCGKIPENYFDLLPEIKSVKDINCFQADIVDTHFRKFMELENLRQLRIFGATHISTEAIAGIGKHTDLVELELTWGPRITDELLSEIAQLYRLESLYLASLTPSCSSKGLLQLLRLKNLSTLWAHGYPVDRELIRGLAASQSLEELSVFHLGLGAADVKQLTSSTSIETLILNNMTQLTVQDFQLIQQIPTLRKLVIEGSSLSKAEIQSLKDANPSIKIEGYGPEGR